MRMELKIEINLKRWKEAQKYEKEGTVGYRYAMEHSRKRYEKYFEFMNKYLCIDSSDKILDIGCKQYGMIHLIEKGERYGLDPLIGSIYHEPNNSAKEVGYIISVGEFLPLKNNILDIIIMTNTLDHMYKPIMVLKDIYRCLDKNGRLVLSLNTFGFVNKIYRVIREKISIGDIFHPFCFSCTDVEKMLSITSFKVIGIKSFEVFETMGAHKVLRKIYEKMFTKIDKILDKRVRHPSVDTLFLCIKS